MARGRVWIALSVVLLWGCGTDRPVQRLLEARLKSLADLGKPDLSSDDLRQALARQLRAAPKGAKEGPGASKPAFPTRSTLQDFYADNAYRLAWFEDTGRSRPSAKIFLEALRRAGEHGLDPEDYYLSGLERRQERIGKANLDESAASGLADFDLLMTSSFFRYASDLSTGRVHPDEIRSDWHTNPPELDVLAMLGRALRTDKLPELLESLPPPHAGYARLRDELRGLREIKAAGGWPVVPAGPEMKPGSRGPRVSLLRQRLAERGGKEGASLPASTAGDRFDTPLSESLRRFQERHGIEPHGKLSSETLAALNVPVDRRIRQVELNLERWRWIPRQLGEPHVLVNIAGFRLELVRKGSSVWRTRIVVGKAYTPTPVFSDRIVAIVANPPWNVPEGIAVHEYVRELQKDPRALEREGIRLLKGSGEDAVEIDPATVDWQSIDENAEFPFRLRQDPGPDNALGRLKFQLTNDFQIYLHDTPAKSLFDQSDRDLSHGCIRVEKPLELAQQILDDSSRQLLGEALQKPEERDLPVKPPVSIHILYLTAWAGEEGLHFAQDIYDLDGPQAAAIEKASLQNLKPSPGAPQPTPPVSGQ
ncbi:MAG TPA: L,D-transpeptidase family protein [Candidatus Polarisedimenticolia bacterium]|jgi:murein L,D-transpeptidase YcbB/YkuD|nr:L,D-transpeptidase family protein [Candidatus Polarisedimenticolia bacterium]